MITISLCMIVKDEEAVLERILKTAREFADEILIADTGSSDHTQSIAETYADRVFQIPWTKDFSAARNFICSKASMDYWMWLDADDVMAPGQIQALLKLKQSLDPEVDVVMMKYITAFDAQDRPLFSFFRERLLKTSRMFQWQGRVHEAVACRGNILYSNIEIQHRKVRPSSPGRNLSIYQDMLRQGEVLSPRHQYYYARELMAQEDYAQAALIFEAFLSQPEGWKENKIDACLQLSRCLQALGAREQAFQALTRSFLYGRPRKEHCCGIGDLLMEQDSLLEAVFWYQLALESPWPETTEGFSCEDYREFIPCIRLCQCWDRLGDHEKAFQYHLRCMALKPESPWVVLNQKYYQSLTKQTTSHIL